MKLLTTKEFGEKVNLTSKRILQLIQSGELPAEQFGRFHLIEDTYIPMVKDRPEKRGRKRKNPTEVAA